ncbi:DNA-nicking Smr family endonuclease [Volucribacter psittacicida]|uniref:Ribosome rescue factor SmrB n=1 Tax=Volucribacter psittacicida TaxID=203482 RepID=A0A4V2PB69_9PAST|nr:endonuclease SmrB [Volucribacter psittacicida]TCJ96205.1 DNA-nicking Smr family endonuclease [Volucribacter psittacicida]
MKKLAQQDIALFREATKGCKPIKQDSVIPTRNRKIVQSVAKREQREQQDNLFYFSDQYEPLLNEDNAVKYLREGENPHLLKQLRRGDFCPDLFLDLHGLTKQQAKQELAALLLVCEKEHIFCASIMTGYGTFTLKRKIPRWLVQHPRVRALHQAPKEWGGEAAILILLDT